LLLRQYHKEPLMTNRFQDRLRHYRWAQAYMQRRAVNEPIQQFPINEYARNSDGSSSTLSITVPGAYYYLTTASPYDIGSTLQIGDSDDVGGTYTFAITLGSTGTLTLSGTTGLTGSGDGTGSLSYSGTLANWNAALNGADIAGLSDEAASLSLVLTRDADSESISKTRTINAYPALAISTLAPADNATDVAVDRATYTATFSRNIQLGTGDITLKLVGGAAVETFNAATGIGDQTGLVAVSGAGLIISPGVTLSGETEYAIQIAATAVDGSDIGTGDSFAGIADDTTWSFTTEDVDAPTIVSLNPADDSTNHLITNPFVATFNENIAFGTGDIRLVETGVGTVETFNVVTETGDDGGTVAISTTALTITPGSDLVDETAYHIEIDATAIEDTSGNAFAGIADATTWNFTATDFTPASLFASGEDGGVYDPSDLTSMFVERGGTTYTNPEVGDVVGTVLDKREMDGTRLRPLLSHRNPTF
jgi:hypothetical protein